MTADWRRQALQLPAVGELSQAAVRAAYWRLVGANAGGGERLKEAKRQLLYEAGARLPPSKRSRL